MEITIKKAVDGGSVKAIASKSQAHRILVCAAVSDAPVHVICSESSADIEATIRCIEALGADISRTGNGFIINPIKTANVIKNAELDCGESGTTLRFMLPMCCALGADAALYAFGRLPQRPMAALSQELSSHGCTLTEHGIMPLKCGGQLKSGEYVLPGDVSSQFISGLLLALPLIEGDSVIELTGSIESKPYIDLTISILSKFGVEIISKENGRFYKVRGKQKYQSPGIINVEGDWSNAAFWLCAGAVSKSPITCTNLNFTSLQGDIEVLHLLKHFGAEVEYGNNSATVSKSLLRGIEIDAQNIPDLVPVLAAVAAVAEGETVIKNAQRLRMKESDRLFSVTEMLTSLGADIRQTEDGLIINGKQCLEGGRVDSFGDHRIAMTASVLACVCKNPVTIKGADAVTKSYPAFFDDFVLMGGEIDYS